MLGVWAFLHFSGWFADPQLALRELEQRKVKPVVASVFAAAVAGDAELLTLLSRAQVSVVKPNERGDTALNVAISARQWHAARALIEAMPELDLHNMHGQVPLQIAFKQGGYETANELLIKGALAQAQFNGVPALLAMLKAGDHRGAQILLQHGADPNAESERGEVPLYLTAKNGHSEWMLRLLEAGADPNGMTPGGQPILSYLLEHPDHSGLSEPQLLELTRLLVNWDVDLEKADSEGWRPIHYALASGFQSVTAELLPLVENVDGTLWIAFATDDFSRAADLLAKGADVHEVNAQGDSALIGMIRRKQPKMVRLLMDHGADPLQLAPEGQAAIPLSIALGHDQVTLTLIQHAYAPAPDTYLITPASREFRKLFRSALLEFYIRGSLKRITPLMAATCLDQKEVVLALLAKGANRYATTAPIKVFPVQLAAKRENVQMQQILIGVPWEDHKQERLFEVNLARQTVTYYKNRAVVKSSGLSSGRSTHPTLPGKFVITDKEKMHHSNLYASAKMPFFQRFSCTAIGFHEGVVPGYPASHGCLRLPANVARLFFRESKVGDRVVILAE
jgi:ankyrin repeat protein